MDAVLVFCLVLRIPRVHISCIRAIRIDRLVPAHRRRRPAGPAGSPAGRISRSRGEIRGRRLAPLRGAGPRGRVDACPSAVRRPPRGPSISVHGVVGVRRSVHSPGAARPGVSTGAARVGSLARGVQVSFTAVGSGMPECPGAGESVERRESLHRCVKTLKDNDLWETPPLSWFGPDTCPPYVRGRVPWMAVGAARSAPESIWEPIHRCWSCTIYEPHS
jgi:hypothetical protein